MAILCEACNRKFYESVVRECPMKAGHFICLYCCHKCKRQYKGEWVGWGCMAFDEQRSSADGVQRRRNGESV